MGLFACAEETPGTGQSIPRERTHVTPCSDINICGGQSTASYGQSRFVDVAGELGIDFVHENGASAEKNLPETNGAGSAFLDYDADGDWDLYLVNSGDMEQGRGAASNQLFRNDGRAFVRMEQAAGAPGTSYGMGVTAADFDGDGGPDLYLTAWGPDQFYRRAENGYVDATAPAGLGHAGWTTSAVAFDYDLDGDLDLFVAQYVRFVLGQQPWCGRQDMGLRFYCDPRVFASTADILYRNDGGVFAEVSRPAGIQREGNGLGVVAGDFDQDGDPDLYVANDLTPNFHYLNQGDGTFAETGLLAGTALSADGASQAGMGVDAGDIDQDGDLDLFVTNYQLENNGLYRNDGSFYSEISFKAGLGDLSLNYLGFGTGFFDADNDGLLDLFVGNGHVHDNIEAYDELVTYAQQAQLFRNEGTGVFSEVTADSGPAFAASYVVRGSSFGDIDLDGDLDVVLVNNGRRCALLRNDGPWGNYLAVALEGRASNRDGIGTRLYLWADGRRQLREVKAGSGFLSTSQRDPIFGLGKAERVERLEIHWPAGGVQVLADVAANQRLYVVED